MGDILGKLTNFDKLIGERLIKILYFIGLVIIAIGFLFGIIAAVALLGQGFGAFLVQLILTPVFTLLAVLFWRFTCELYILFFSMHNKLTKLTEIAERTHPAPTTEPGTGL